MAYTYEEIIPSPIENTVVEKMLRDGEHTSFRITVNEGYVLHDNRNDEPIFDDNGEETGEHISFYCSGSTTVWHNYDFADTENGTYTYIDENGMEVTIPVVMVGGFQLYTLPASVVPANQIYGSGGNHETV